MDGYTQLLTHLVGDYWLQSDWMAVNKSKNSLHCLVHVFIYTLCFLIVGMFTGGIAPFQLLIIGGTHFFIDRFGLQRYLIYAKNWLMSPKGYSKSWEECKLTGLDPDRPVWLTVWLSIICDNILHLVINAVALSL